MSLFTDFLKSMPVKWRWEKDADGSLAQMVVVEPTSRATQTAVTVGTSSGLVVAARAKRRRLMIQNIGAYPVTIAYGDAAAVAGSGFVLDPGSAANRQGGAIEEMSIDCWPGAVQAIAVGGSSTVIVMEG